MTTHDCTIICPTPAQVLDAETAHTRARQRYESSKRACMEMFGTLSILVVPSNEYQALAAASWDVERTRDRLGDLQARRRGYMSLMAA